MNLQSQITEIRSRIAEEYPGEDSDAPVKDDEIVAWIWAAEIQLCYDVVADALATSALSARTGLSTTGAESDSVTLPTNFLRPVHIGLRQRSATPYIPCRMVSFDELRRAYGNPNFRNPSNAPLASIWQNNIYTYPARASGGSVDLTYIVKPTRRYRHYRGSLTSKTSNTSWVDSKLITLGYPDDYFNGCSLRYTTGEPRGHERTVTDYTGSSGTFALGSTTDTFPPDVNVPDEFEVGEVSLLPEIFENPMLHYATYMALRKDRDEEAQKCLAEYGRQIQQINTLYGGVK